MPQPSSASSSASAFALPDRLAAKADPALVAADEARFAAVARRLDEQVAALGARLAEERRAPGREGQQALERDLAVHRLAAQLRVLRRFGVEACLGRIVPESGDPVWIGRIGLADADGAQLLVDWRTPAAEPFFAATRARPMGLESRRRYRWAAGRVRDYWDEALAPGALAGSASLDEESALLASLEASRDGRMQDVLGTIQADQDAIVRAPSRGVLVVDGGPGTGKTVVALHRAAYLLHADPRVDEARGGVLVVGPSDAYRAFVEDVLPSLGEDGVRTCTVRDLVPEGAAALPESPEVAALKGTTAMVDALEPAVRLWEEVPAGELVVETPWVDVVIGPEHWAEAFRAAEGVPHDDAREAIREALLEVLLDEHADPFDLPAPQLRRALLQDPAPWALLDRAWPILDPGEVLAALWSTPAFLARCAPHLSPAEVALLQREEPRAWTTADLPLLDALRHRVGDPAAVVRRARAEREARDDRERMDRVVADLIAADDDGEGLVTMLQVEDAQRSLEHAPELPSPDELAGPFAHVVVDEAQELTDAEWRMLVRRVPSRSLTVVGDRAQARGGFAEGWAARLERVGLRTPRLATLGVNYRTPAEVMAVAEPAVRAALPDANVPVSIRSSGVPVRRGRVAELDAVLDGWLSAHEEGVACVIGVEAADRPRVRSLTPATAKGLEFDLVVLVRPAALGDGVQGAVDRYVSMTRATRELVLLD